MKQKFIYSLMDAGTEKEVSNIVTDNLELLFNYPELWRYVRNSKRRIKRIKREKMKHWYVFEMN
jgi:hypothetical protein